MKRILAIIISSGVVIAVLALAQVQTPKDGAIQLPTVATIKLKTILYQYSSAPQIMGDGYRAYVVQVDSGDLAEFIKSNVSIDPQWTRGSMQDYRMYLEVLEWIEGGESALSMTNELSKSVDLDEIKHADGLLFRAEVKRNGDGILTDATLWIIRPELNQIIMFNQNT